MATITTALGLMPALRHLMFEELLRAQVGAEAGLGHGVLGEPHRELRGQDAVAAVGDVGERAAVDERRVVLQRLHQVRLDGVLQQHGHRPVGLQIGGGDRLSSRGCRPTMIRPNRSFNSLSDSERQKTAITSEATVMS